MTKPFAVEREYDPTKDKAALLHAIGVGELMALDLPERKKLTPWLIEGGLVMVYGPRGVGKTFFTLSLAISLASGQPFLKWPVEEPVGVLLIDGEMALGELRDRIVELLPDKPRAPLEIVSHELVYEYLERDLNLGVEEWQNAVYAYVDSHPEIRVIIFDNLGCLLRTVREDKRDDWATCGDARPVTCCAPIQ